MNNLYINNDYLINNPLLHEEDSPWKIEKLLPLVKKFAGLANKREINLLDVGGGAGLILKAIADYLENDCGIKVNKYSLDLSPGMLLIQAKNNPDLKKQLNESICRTSLNDKEIDLALMIDILEHVPDDTAALEELKRISRFVIFKIPLEDNLLVSTLSRLNIFNSKKYSKEKYGHVQFYKYRTMIRKIRGHLGQPLSENCANVYDYFRNSRHYNVNMRLKRKLFYTVIAWLSRILPLTPYTRLFGDFAIVLVKNY